MFFYARVFMRCVLCVRRVLRPEDIRECVNTLPQFEWLRDDLPIAAKPKNALSSFKKPKVAAPAESDQTTEEQTEEGGEADGNSNAVDN